MSRDPIRRIVCLTEEPTEILYLLGEGRRVVGISKWTVRPPEAREEKPIVSAFTGGNVKRICALEPDLVIGFSDIQAELASKLIAALFLSALSLLLRASSHASGERPYSISSSL